VIEPHSSVHDGTPPCLYISSGFAAAPRWHTCCPPPSLQCPTPCCCAAAPVRRASIIFIASKRNDRCYASLYGSCSIYSPSLPLAGSISSQVSAVICNQLHGVSPITFIPTTTRTLSHRRAKMPSIFERLVSYYLRPLEQVRQSPLLPPLHPPPHGVALAPVTSSPPPPPQPLIPLAARSHHGPRCVRQDKCRSRDTHPCPHVTAHTPPRNSSGIHATSCDLSTFRSSIAWC